MRTVLSRVLIVAVFGTCSVGPAPAQEPPSKLAATPPQLNKAFAEKLLAAASGYNKIPQVDDKAQWAPVLCAPGASALPKPVGALFSKSVDDGTHGLKLYLLFAKDKQQYTSLGEKSDMRRRPTEPGQVIVKESWIPEKIAADAPPTAPNIRGDLSVPAAVKLPPTKDKQGNLFRCKEKYALFIMLKLDPQTPDTDNGWVYGTVTADGKTVTSAGRVQSCMECHQKAPHDRLFGPARAEE